MVDNAESENEADLVAQINALTVSLGVVIGFMRAKGIASAEDIEGLFELADSLLPAQDGADGESILETLRSVADLMTGSP